MEASEQRERVDAVVATTGAVLVVGAAEPAVGLPSACRDAPMGVGVDEQAVPTASMVAISAAGLGELHDARTLRLSMLFRWA